MLRHILRANLDSNFEFVLYRDDAGRFSLIGNVLILCYHVVLQVKE